MLHADAAWGGGTTEYALEAIKCAAEGELDGAARRRFACPVPLDTALPMIWRDDLAAALVALTDARALAEPDGGYAVAGFSFTPRELFAAIRRTRAPAFEADDDSAESGAAAAFAALWPDTLSGAEARRDLGFAPTTGLDDAVRAIFDAHVARAAGKT